MSLGKQTMQASIDTMQTGIEAHTTLMDDYKKTWICLQCNSSFFDHDEIVVHMHSENHIVIARSDFTPSKETPQADIRTVQPAIVA